MMCKLFSLCAGVVLATLMALSCSPARAQTETITFTDLPPASYIPNGYGNLTWGNFGAGNPYPGYPAFPEYGAYTLNGDESAFYTDGGPFALISISLTSMYLTGENVQIWGYGPSPNGPPPLIDDYDNDGGVNVSPGDTVTLDLDWTGLQYVALNPRGGTPIGQYPGPNGGSTQDVVITSMTINYADVIPTPEPPAAVLLGIGGVAIAPIAFVRRRRGSFAALVSDVDQEVKSGAAGRCVREWNR
jgi:hypothetical protein